MLITKEQQEDIIDKYIQANHSVDECTGFIDGMKAMFELIMNNDEDNGTKILFDFLIFLNKKKYINDYDFDYEKQIKKFIKSTKKLK